MFTITGVLQVVMLVITVTISVRKPWGVRVQKKASLAESKNSIIPPASINT